MGDNIAEPWRQQRARRSESSIADASKQTMKPDQHSCRHAWTPSLIDKTLLWCRYCGKEKKA